MSDAYQAVYDATRSRISSCDVGAAVRDVALDAFDISHAKALLQEQIGIVGEDLTRPHVLMRPTLTIDGNKWRALYGENLQDGVAGFGDSPHEACLDFNRAWFAKLTPTSATP